MSALLFWNSRSGNGDVAVPGEFETGDLWVSRFCVLVTTRLLRNPTHVIATMRDARHTLNHTR